MRQASFEGSQEFQCDNTNMFPITHLLQYIAREHDIYNEDHREKYNYDTTWTYILYWFRDNIGNLKALED